MIERRTLSAKTLCVGGLVTAAVILSLATRTAEAQVKLIVQGGSSVPTMQTSPIYIAQQAGFFKEEGIDVEYRHSAGASQALQIVSSGGADIASLTLEPLILGYDKGIRGKVFYQNYTRSIYFVAVPANSDIKTIADLKGKKIGVASLASASLIIAKSMLLESGLPATDDLFLPVGAGSAALAALRNKQVAAISLWDSAYAAMETAGNSFRYLKHPTLASVGNGGYFVLDRTLADKRAAMVGFGRAIAKATTFMLASPEAAVRIYWKVGKGAKTGPTDVEALAKAVKEMKLVSQSFSLEGRADKRMGATTHEGVTKLIEAFARVGVIPRTFPASELLTGDLTAEINKFDVARVQKLARDWK